MIVLHLNQIREPYRRIVIGSFGLLAAGLLLLVGIMLSEKLLLPFWLEPAGRLVFRIAFLVTLPFRALVFPFLPPVDHHYSTAHFVVTCLGTPFFYALLCALVSKVFKIAACARFFPHAQRDKVSTTQENRPNLTRRAFFAEAGAGATLAALGGVGVYSTWLEPSQLKIRRYVVPVSGLPPALDGMRLVHISDTHYGPYNSLSEIEHAIEAANSLKGDLVVLTGDYVHFTPSSVQTGIGVLSGLKAKYGVVAVMGNHEHWEGTEFCRGTFRHTGIPLIDNGRLFLTRDGLSEDERPDALCVAGLGDYWEDKLLFDQALGGVPRRMPRIVLSHNPAAADFVGPDLRIDLMFSGHTHGGQVRVPGLPAVGLSKAERRYLGGLCQGPQCPVVVSRGVGMAGIPVRFRVYPEIGEIRLVRA